MRKKLLIFAMSLFWMTGIALGNTNNTKHTLTGQASYYGSQYTTKRHTANGDVFNKNAYTAAHKTLPFGTIVKVTNLRNNKTVTVKINDRGPFVKGRVIDLTPVAARDINMIKSGTVPVKLKIVSMPQPTKKKRKR